MVLSQGLYEVIALGARYAFAALMVLIVARAWRNTVVDSRRAQTLRRLMPQTGLCGELVVMEGDEQSRRGMKYPVIREGLIGSSRRADIRIRNSSIRRRHAYFQLLPEGLRLQAHAGAPIYDRQHRLAKSLLLKDGNLFALGRVQLMLILTESTIDDIPEVPTVSDADWLFETQPVLNRTHRLSDGERRYAEYKNR